VKLRNLVYIGLASIGIGLNAARSYVLQDVGNATDFLTKEPPIERSLMGLGLANPDLETLANHLGYRNVAAATALYTDGFSASDIASIPSGQIRATLVNNWRQLKGSISITDFLAWDKMGGQKEDITLVKKVMVRGQNFDEIRQMYQDHFGNGPLINNPLFREMIGGSIGDMYPLSQVKAFASNMFLDIEDAATLNNMARDGWRSNEITTVVNEELYKNHDLIARSHLLFEHDWRLEDSAQIGIGWLDVNHRLPLVEGLFELELTKEQVKTRMQQFRFDRASQAGFISQVAYELMGYSDVEIRDFTTRDIKPNEETKAKSKALFDMGIDKTYHPTLIALGIETNETTKRFFDILMQQGSKDEKAWVDRTLKQSHTTTLDVFTAYFDGLSHTYRLPPINEGNREQMFSDILTISSTEFQFDMSMGVPRSNVVYHVLSEWRPVGKIDDLPTGRFSDKVSYGNLYDDDKIEIGIYCQFPQDRAEAQQTIHRISARASKSGIEFTMLDSFAAFTNSFSHSDISMYSGHANSGRGPDFSGMGEQRDCWRIGEGTLVLSPRNTWTIGKDDTVIERLPGGFAKIKGGSEGLDKVEATPDAFFYYCCRGNVYYRNVLETKAPRTEFISTNYDSNTDPTAALEILLYTLERRLQVEDFLRAMNRILGRNLQSCQRTEKIEYNNPGPYPSVMYSN